MKSAFLTFAFLFANFLSAAQPPDLGHFKGLAFSSATDRHPVEIQGGTLVRCKKPERASDITQCEVENGTLVVTGAPQNALNVALTRVSVLRTLGDSPTHYYYFRGSADLVVGERPITTAVRATLVVEDKTPDTVRGYIGFPIQDTRSAVEAYRINP